MLSNKPGRPSKLTPSRVRILSECFQNAMTTNIACDFANISRDTYYNWYEKDEDFRTQMNYSKALAAKDLLKKIKEKDPWKLLKNIYKGEYIDEPAVQINVDERLDYYASLSDEELMDALDNQHESSKE